jgi:hypothetical protein
MFKSSQITPNLNSGAGRNGTAQVRSAEGRIPPQ